MKYLIKICGITSEKDLKAARKLGANFVGFVLVEKSKRFIDLKKLESLSMMVSKPLKSVALLVDPSDDFLEKLLLRSKVDFPNIRKYENSVDYILLDSKVKENGHLKGGRGISFNWNIIKGFNFKKPWFLAGGLNTNNVIAAVNITGAKMLDVSTGVETKPGEKSFDKMREFIGRVNGEFI